MKKPTSKLLEALNSLLVIFIGLKLASIVFGGWSVFTTPFDPAKAEFTYSHSQYNLGRAEFFGNIDDDLLHQYAGHKYITGTDPTTINPEAPYLIKYLYGLSILVFGNAHIIQLIFSISLLIVTFLLARQILINTTLALLSSSFLTLDPLFIHQITHTLLDLPHALFIVLAISFFLKYKKTHNTYYLLLAAISLGAIATTKLFITAVLLWLVMIFFIKKSRSNLISLTLPAILVYLVTFTVFFISHPNPVDFLNFHIELARLYRSYLPNYPPFELLRIIFFGKWQTWWGPGIINSPFWSILWPISTLSALFAFYKSLKPRNPQLLLISSFSLLYLFSNLFHVVFPRYLLSVLPLMYISLLYSLREALEFLKKRLNIKH